MSLFAQSAKNPKNSNFKIADKAKASFSFI